MKFKKLANRLTGFSTPVFGVSWTPEKMEQEVAQKLITELEDKRVLYNPSEMEVPRHCVHSIVDIRRLLTELLHDLDPGSKLSENIKAIRASCRKFLNTVQSDETVLEYGDYRGHHSSWVFNGAIGELRGVIGIHLAIIATQYGLDIEEPLLSILPVEDEPNESE